MKALLERERLEFIRDRLGDRRWHELSIEELASAAGLSRMTLHRRGISKDDLRDALTQLLAEEHKECVVPALTAPGDAKDRLRTALEGVCRVDERYLGLLEALGDNIAPVFHEEGEGEVLTKGAFIDAVRRILEDGEREGTLDCGPGAAETATLLLNATSWTYQHMRIGHHWSEETARGRVVDLLVAGVSK
ncbi:MAG: TetR/AcrR family transcriptional regulator [Solirubrobacterales bacterium]|nr:TetR/AcrR family transcriptional regulator [Solirubrobacterales bacterium]